MNIFEQATRIKLRFNINGLISVEHLWDLKAAPLEKVEQELTEIVEKYAKSTRRKRTYRTVEQVENELRLAIVTHILDVKEAEKENEVIYKNVKQQLDELNEIELTQQKTALQNMTPEQIKAKRAELEAMLKS